jgi:type III secretion protein C
MNRIVARIVLLLVIFINPLAADEDDNAYTINFKDVPVVEFIQFVSRISDVNFIFNHRDLQFNITLSSGKPVSSDQVVKALVQVLKAHGFSIGKEDGYLVIHKGVAAPLQPYDKSTPDVFRFEEPLAVVNEKKPQFLVHKLQYHEGSELEETIKKITADFASKPDTSPRYLSVLKSIQWIKATNSIVCSGDEESLQNVKQLIQSLDAPLRQVFIEILVVETDARNTADFGLEWAAGGKYKDALGMGGGQFNKGGGSSFASNFQGINASNTPSGPSQFPLGNAFDMGVIGDIIFHKGRSFISLGSLVSALQADGNTSIVLNQKIITQDNKNSTIFVGDNIPFTGSIVQTTGVSQQTTANVEYRDIGVNLSITPRLGEDDVITLDLNEEITEAIPTDGNPVSTSQVAGIKTTKTNMMTHVHVPDRHFLVLSGMIRNAKSHHKAGLPCLGGIPGLGVLFSKTKNYDEKRNIIIFVRPHIIRSFEDYKKITEKQEDLYRSESDQKAFDRALDLVKDR